MCSKNIHTLLEDTFCFLFYQDRSGDRHSVGCSPTPRELLYNIQKFMFKVIHVTKSDHVFIFALIIPLLIVSDMVSKAIITIYMQFRPSLRSIKRSALRGGGPASSVGLATGYGLDGQGIESRWGGGEIFRTCPDQPWGPPSLLYNGYRVFTGGKKRPRRDADPSPPSSAMVKKG